MELKLERLRDFVSGSIQHESKVWVSLTFRNFHTIKFDDLKPHSVIRVVF